MKTALVLEGGAMQGLYTVGVLDTFMDHGITFDAVIGVSAGALFGVNFLSGQKGRALRYNQRYNKNKNYMGVKALVKTGNIINTKLAYEVVPHKLDPFDNETYKKSKIPFYVVVTNIHTGEAEYIQLTDVFEQMDTLRASGSMPFVSKPVRIGNRLYLDGAIADSIPFEKMLEMGYERLVVILTKDATYVKKPINKALATRYYGEMHPRFAEKIINRHVMYNGQMERLMEAEKQGIAEVIRPSEPFYISKLERDEEKMQKLYELGQKDAMEWLKAKAD